MKTMTCNKLHGACDMELHGETFDDLMEESKKHAMEMLEKEGPEGPHGMKMNEMRSIMGDTAKMEEFNKSVEALRGEFEALPEDE